MEKNIKNICVLEYIESSPGGSLINNLPAMQETWVLSLGQEDQHPLQYSCLGNPMDRRVGHDLVTKPPPLRKYTHTHTQLNYFAVHRKLTQHYQSTILKG